MLKDRIKLSLFLFTLFTIGYFITDVPGTAMSDYKGFWYLPFFFISLIPGFIAFMVECWRGRSTGDLIMCTFIPHWITYFGVSLLISLLPVLIYKVTHKGQRNRITAI